MAGANGYFPAERYNERIEEYGRAALEYHAVNLILSIILFLRNEVSRIFRCARLPISRIRKITSRNRDVRTLRRSFSFNYVSFYDAVCFPVPLAQWIIEIIIRILKEDFTEALITQSIKKRSSNYIGLHSIRSGWVSIAGKRRSKMTCSFCNPFVKLLFVEFSIIDKPSTTLICLINIRSMFRTFLSQTSR